MTPFPLEDKQIIKGGDTKEQTTFKLELEVREIQIF